MLDIWPHGCRALSKFYTHPFPTVRIADMRIAVDGQKSAVEATWTAPGDDFDHGSASGYKFVFSLDVADLAVPGRSPPVLHSVEGRSDEAGTEQSHTFPFRHRYD